MMIIDFIDWCGMRTRSQERVPGKAGLKSMRSALMFKIMDPWSGVLFQNRFLSLAPNMTHPQHDPKPFNIYFFYKFMYFFEGNPRLLFQIIKIKFPLEASPGLMEISCKTLIGSIGPYPTYLN